MSRKNKTHKFLFTWYNYPWEGDTTKIAKCHASDAFNKKIKIIRTWKGVDCKMCLAQKENK